MTLKCACLGSWFPPSQSCLSRLLYLIREIKTCCLCTISLVLYAIRCMYVVHSMSLFCTVCEAELSNTGVEYTGITVRSSGRSMRIKTVAKSPLSDL